MNEVTCILTSCGRFDLLRITLDSFFKFNTYDIKEFYVYEDSDQIVPTYLKQQYPLIRWLDYGSSYNQIKALDELWSRVTTPYAFTMEDDWETYRGGFIEASMEILEAHPKIMHVWLRELEDMNQHPVEWNLGETFGRLKASGNLWSGTRFNPSLKRKSDYDLIGSYGKYATFDPHRPWKAEATISQVYYKFGFSAAILPQGYIRHIGQNRHVGP